jgi:lipid II:glycine glycyltransferase (peptidoglycan interpeptide bridge formation enzyme)
MFNLLQAYTQSVKPRPLFTELRNISDYSELQATLNKCGFVFEGHLNYLINLDQSNDAIWQGISKSVRKHIRNSQRKGVEVIDLSDRQQLIAGYELIKMVYKRIRVPLASFKLFESAFEILVPRGMLKIFLARVKNHYISIRLVLTYKGVVYDWYMGTDRKFSSYYAEELLIWHTLHWGKENNFRLFDFGGAGKPEEEYGPRQFKAKWGGTLVNYGRNIYVHSPCALKLSKAGYELLRRVPRI